MLVNQNQISLMAFNQTIKNAKMLETDLVEMSIHDNACPICEDYQGRVFSISGKDKRFPILPNTIFKNGCLHEGCRHSFFPFIYGINKPMSEQEDIIAYSNRPFKQKIK